MQLVSALGDSQALEAFGAVLVVALATRFPSKGLVFVD